MRKIDFANPHDRKRMIKGKEYVVEAYTDTKRDANIEANKWRRSLGCRARVIKVDSPFGKYAVFIHHSWDAVH